MKELGGTSFASIASMQEEILFVFPTRAFGIMSYYGSGPETLKTLLARGVKTRGIADISCKDAPCAGIEPIQPVQELLKEGIDIRYLDHCHRLSFAVSDEKTNVYECH